jgi:hypothetical protein
MDVEDELRKLKAMPREDLELEMFSVQRVAAMVIPGAFLLLAVGVTWDMGDFRWFILGPAALMCLTATFRASKMVPKSTVGGVEKRSGIPGYVGSGNLKEARLAMEPRRIKDGSWGVVLQPKSRVSGWLIAGTLIGGAWMFIAILIGKEQLTPGVIVGCVSMVCNGPCIYYWLKAIGPSVQLTFPSNVIPLGSTLKVRWEVKGIGQVTGLKIYIVGKERTIYTRGTTTCTDESVLAEFTLANTDNPKMIQEGKASIEIPPLIMHTFNGGSNSIFWEVKVEGVVPFWPDTNDTYPIILVPPEVQS